MNNQQLRLAYMIRTGSARPDDLQELADGILAECHHPSCTQCEDASICDLCKKRIEALPKLPPGCGHSWSCTCDECVPPSVDPPAVCRDIAARGALDSEELEPRQTLHVLKNRDVPSNMKLVYVDPTKFAEGRRPTLRECSACKGTGYLWAGFEYVLCSACSGSGRVAA